MKRRLPSTAYNFTSLIGACLALFAVAAILILYFLDFFSTESNPYLGIFIYLLFPGILVAGLAVIPFGMWIERRRRLKGNATPLVLNLGLSSHRNGISVFVIGTSVFLLLTTVGLYKGYQYTESVEFCGKVCHSVMEPEYTAYFNSPHAKVGCVHCHIGSGAGWYVKSKMSGARQVFRTVLNSYERPVATPIKDLRPAQETCEECHWPEKFFDATQRTYDYFLGDEENTRWQLAMLMNVGGVSPEGRSTGIHWHVSEENHVTYVASDSSRQELKRVEWEKGGKRVVYTIGGRPMPDSVLVEARTKGYERTMDCMDCHNRPSHKYRSPMKAVNTAMASGELDPGIPNIKREAVGVLSRRYDTSEEAMEGIQSGLTEFYEDEGFSLPAEAISAVQQIYSENMFPKMGVRWDEYPENEGHFLFPGCFRCHGSELETEDGETISSDCNLCHTIIAQGPFGELANSLTPFGQDFQHPVDIDGAEVEMLCIDCHSGDDSLY